MAFLLGLEVETGFGGVLFVLLIAVGWGLAFAGYSVGIALRTRNAQAAQAGTFIFFPLIFLSTTFVPYELFEAQWMKITATINPTTYIFESMRTVLIDGWIFLEMMQGVFAIIIVSAITITFAAVSAKGAVSRK